MRKRRLRGKRHSNYWLEAQNRPPIIIVSTSMSIQTQVALVAPGRGNHTEGHLKIRFMQPTIRHCVSHKNLRAVQQYQLYFQI